MNVRGDFPILQRKVNGKPLVYLDNAATTQKPTQVIDAITDFYTTHNGNPGRGVHALAHETSELFEEARKKVARFINAKPEEIIFTNNTTQGLNMLAELYSKRLNNDDNVVTTIMEHHSNYVPWKIACRNAKCKLNLVDINDEGSLDMKDYENKTTSKTKIVSVLHTSNVLGTINPAKEMAKIAHENGATFILDGAQSVPHMKTDVKKLDCDFLAFSGHKMLAPMGIGVLYGKRELLEEMEPPVTGGGTVSKTYQSLEFLKSPDKFEAGTPNVGGAIALGTAIDYLNKIGMDKVQKHEEKLTKYALDNLDIKTYGPKDRVGIIAFNIPRLDSDEVSTLLDEHGIATRSGQHCTQPLMHRLGVDGTARMSFYLYNTKEEIDYTLSIIEKIKKLA